MRKIKSDTELVEEANSGNASAFAELLARHTTSSQRTQFDFIEINEMNNLDNEQNSRVVVQRSH